MDQATDQKSSQTTKIIVAVALLLIAAVVLWLQLRTPAASSVGTKVWYYDLGSKSLVVVSTSEIPSRPELVKARVFSSGSCKDPAKRAFYLEKAPPPAPAGEGPARGADDDRPGSRRGGPEAGAAAVRRVADPDKPEEWVDASTPEGRGITQLAGKAPAGAALTECFPD